MKRLTLLVGTVLMGLSLAACGEYMNKKPEDKGSQVHPTMEQQDKTMHPTHEVKPDMNQNTGSTTTNPNTTNQPTH